MASNVQRWHDMKGLSHPVLYLPMWDSGNMVYDLSGNNYHGAIVNLPWSTTPQGPSLYWDNSTNKYISLPIPVSGYPFTVIGISSITETPTGGSCLFAINEFSSNEVSWLLDYAETVGIGYRAVARNTGYTAANSAYLTTAFTFVSATFTAAQRNIYIKGRYKATDNTSVPWNSAVDRCTIGVFPRNSSYTTSTMFGHIPFISVYDVLLVPDQHLLLSEEPYGALYPVSVPIYFFMPEVGVGARPHNPLNYPFSWPLGGPI